MSVEVREKLAQGKTLNDDEVRYARERGVELDEEKYGPAPPANDDPAAMANAPHISGDDSLPGLDVLSKDELRQIAGMRGVEVPASANKARLIAALTGEDEEEEREDETEDESES